MSSVKRGRSIGTRRFRVRGQRTPEVNKVALTALKYFIALISAALILTALTIISIISSSKLKRQQALTDPSIIPSFSMSLNSSWKNFS